MTREVTPDWAVVDAAAGLLADPAQQRVLDEAYQSRLAAAEDIGSLLKAAQPSLPELPDSRAREVYERLQAAERSVVGASLTAKQYEFGTATTDDEILAVGQGAALMDAGHATSPIRKADAARGRMVRGSADPGTGGLALVLAEDGLGKAVIPIGRQTSNTNNSGDDHPLKVVLGEELDTRGYDGFTSLHGCYDGKVTSLLDRTAIHAVVGLGANPSELSYEAAEWLVRQAREQYGLHVVIGNLQPHLNTYDPSAPVGDSTPNFSRNPNRQADGSLAAASRLAAAGDKSVVTFVGRRAPDIPIMQLEISNSVLVTPDDRPKRRDPGHEAMAAYMGYELAALAVRACTRRGTLDI